MICFEFFLELFYHEIDGNLPCSSNKREVINEITMDRSVPCCIEEKLALEAEFVQILLYDRCDRFKSTAHRVLFVIDR